jgi:hypothetical protein
MLMNLINYDIKSSKRDIRTGKFIFSIRKPDPENNEYCSTDFWYIQDYKCCIDT